MAVLVAPPPPHDVSTTLNYYAPVGTDAPYTYPYEPPAGVPKTNVGADARPVIIHDARGIESNFSLDTSGFAFVKHTSEETDFRDEELIKTRYYKEIIELLKKETGAKRVQIFDHTIRRNTEDLRTKENATRGPVERVHVDQTYEASVQRVREHLGEEAEHLLKSRVRLINVWRPIENPVAHKPLAVSDWRFVDTAKDLVPTRLLYPQRNGSNYSVNYNPEHKWYYLSSQTPDEVILIKCYDSAEDKARLTPHSAFVDTTSPPDAPRRQSIEVRALVFDTE